MGGGVKGIEGAEMGGGARAETGEGEAGEGGGDGWRVEGDALHD